jgi:hypothetical protein
MVAESEKLLQPKILNLSNSSQRILKNLQFFLEFSQVKGFRGPFSYLRFIMKKDTLDNLPEHKSSKIAIFKGKQIRKAIHPRLSSLKK